MMKHLVPSILFLIAAVFSTADAQSYEIAIPAFSIAQSADAQAANFADKLGSLLARKSGYTIYRQVELSTKINASVISKIKLEDIKTLADVGTAAGVEYILAGKIDQVGDRIFLTAKLLKVSDRSVLLEISEIVIGDISLLEERIPGIVARLCAVLPLSPRITSAQIAEPLGQIKEFSVKTEAIKGKNYTNADIEGKTGDLYISTVEDSAVIELDGTTLQGTTPLTLKNIPAGLHNIRAQKGDKAGLQQIFLKPSDLLKVTIDLTLGHGTIKLFTEPPGADAMMDGKNAGQTPLKLESLAAGTHQLSMTKRGYFSIKKDIIVEIDKQIEMSDTLKPCAYLTVETQGKNVALEVNNVKFHPDSLRRLEVPVGAIRVKASAEGRQPFSDSFTVVTGEDKHVKISLVSTTSILKVQSQPAGAKVFLNDKPFGITDLSSPVPAFRKYSLRLEKETYEAQACSLYVAGDSTTEISMTLQHTRAFNDSMAKAAKEKRKKFRIIRRVVFGALAAGFGGAGYYFNMKVNDAYDTYNGYKGNDINTHNNNWRKIKDYESTRNIMYYIAGACGIGFGISIPF